MNQFCDFLLRPYSEIQTHLTKHLNQPVWSNYKEKVFMIQKQTSSNPINYFISFAPQLFQFEISIFQNFAQLYERLKNSAEQHENSKEEINKLKAKIIYRTIRDACGKDNIKLDQFLKNTIFSPPLVYDYEITKPVVQDKKDKLSLEASRLWLNNLGNNNHNFNQIIFSFCKTISFYKDINNLEQNFQLLQIINVLDKQLKNKINLLTISPLCKIAIITFLFVISDLQILPITLLMSWLIDSALNQCLPSFPYLISFINILLSSEKENKACSIAYANTINKKNDLTYFIIYFYSLLAKGIKELNSYLDTHLRIYNERNLIKAFNKKVRADWTKYWPHLSKKQINFLVHASNNAYHYSIQDYMELTESCYETARSNLEQLYKYNLLNKQKVNRKFLYIFKK